MGYADKKIEFEIFKKKLDSKNFNTKTGIVVTGRSHVSIRLECKFLVLLFFWNIKTIKKRTQQSMSLLSRERNIQEEEHFFFVGTPLKIKKIYFLKKSKILSLFY
jgi:hypothetical protein